MMPILVESISYSVKISLIAFKRAGLPSVVMSLMATFAPICAMFLILFTDNCLYPSTHCIGLP